MGPEIARRMETAKRARQWKGKGCQPPSVGQSWISHRLLSGIDLVGWGVRADFERVRRVGGRRCGTATGRGTWRRLGSGVSDSSFDFWDTDVWGTDTPKT